MKTVFNIQSKLCDILPENIRKAEYLHEFKNKIKYWTLLNCPSKLRQTCIANAWLRLSISFMSFLIFLNLKLFPNFLNVSTYDNITSIMGQLLFGAYVF